MKNARSLAFLVAATALIAACSDKGVTPAGPSGVRPALGRLAGIMGACTDISTLNSLAASVFGSGSPNVNSVLGKLDNLNKKVQAGNTVDAQAQANNIVTFVRDKAAQGTLPGTQAQITQFISGVLCFAGLSPDTFLILPTDAPQTRIAEDGQSGIQLPGNPVGTPTLLTITTLDPNGPSPLITKLDQYPAYVDFTVSSPIVGTAVVAVCPAVSVPADVRSRLRLGHQASTGFEITPPADGSFLSCSATASASILGGFIRNVASIFLPKPLYAARREFGGIGGSVTELSPFDAVDPELSFRGGIGGSVTELIRAEAPDATATPESKRAGPNTKRLPNTFGGSTTSMPLAKSVVDGVCTEASATVGTALEPECRPVVTLKTHNGTLLQNVPVNWTVNSGGGSIAPSPLPATTCGTFGANASTSTNSSGKAGVCWTLGPDGGQNGSTAVPAPGGDAPAGVSFNPPQVDFIATGLKITPTASATGGSFVYDGTAHAGSGTCSNGLTPAAMYSGGSAPQDVGEYTLTITCGAGSTVYNTVTATAAISIAAAIPSVEVTCPASVVYTGAAQTPCSATATAPGLSLTPTPAYANNVNAGTATASVTLAASGNYGAASGSATFVITPAPSSTTVSCTAASFVYTGSAITPCSAATTGAGGLSSTPAVSYSANTDVGTVTASASYAGDANHTSSSGSAAFAITRAISTTAVNCPASVTFNNGAQTPCSASATGVGGLSQSLGVSYANNTSAGTASASASYAGDPNHSGSSGSATFAILAAPTSVAVSCPTAVAYTASVQSPCTAGVTGPGLASSLGVGYTPSPPRNAGAYTAAASYGAGGNYLGSANSVAFSILQAAATATSGNATINFGAAAPTIPCAVSGLLAADAGTVTCTSSVPAITAAGTYAVTPVVSPASPVNYAVTKVNGALTVAGYVQVGCFSSPLYSVMPESKSAQRKGSNLPVKCALQTPQGAAVTTATANIQVMDAGTSAITPPVKTGPIVFTATNAMKYSTSGNYAYGLDTSPAAFVAGHYYYVIANWNDGSKTEGWFLLK